MKDLPRDTDGRLSAYAWPGGYPIYYVDGWHNVLCVECARRSDADPDAEHKAKPRVAEINWEDADLYCDDCGHRIESAYAEED